MVRDLSSSLVDELYAERKRSVSERVPGLKRVRDSADEVSREALVRRSFCVFCMKPCAQRTMSHPWGHFDLDGRAVRADHVAVPMPYRRALKLDDHRWVCEGPERGPKEEQAPVCRKCGKETKMDGTCGACLVDAALKRRLS